MLSLSFSQLKPIQIGLLGDALGTVWTLVLRGLSVAVAVLLLGMAQRAHANSIYYGSIPCFLGRKKWLPMSGVSGEKILNTLDMGGSHDARRSYSFARRALRLFDPNF